MIKTIFFSIALLSFSAPIFAEETTLVIKWGNLVPQIDPLEDPFKDLTEDQLYDLESIVYYREIEGQQGSITTQDTEDVLNLTANLESENLSVDTLLLTYEKYLKEIERRSWLVNNELNGHLVRLAGYILPLEFNESGTDEFFLVPYIGACIHVPPPPPNQIIYIRTKEKIILKELYRPVWVTGRLVIEASTRNLTFVDGSDDIPFGYTFEDAAIEEYRE